MHPILDIYKDSPIKFTFHCLGLPWTDISDKHISCAYSSKMKKFIKMMSDHGHHIIAYGNEGSVVPDGVELVQIFSEDERQKWFSPGPFDTAANNIIKWDCNEVYWRAFGLRIQSHLIHRAKQGDFVCTVGGGSSCYKYALEQFPGCDKYGSTNVICCDIGSGHFGWDTEYVAYESATWREHIKGKYGHDWERYTDAVVPNYFDIDDFAAPNSVPRLIDDPYYLFIGRIIDSKRWQIAVQVAKILGVKIVLAGQGDPGTVDDHVIHYGLANVEQRKSLYANAIATFVPTNYTPPLEGVSIESMMSGTPAITSDHGSFCENTPSEFRCSTLREYVEAAKYAATLSMDERMALRKATQDKFSLEAVYPLFNRWFHRLYMLRHNGWNETRDFKDLI